MQRSRVALLVAVAALLVAGGLVAFARPLVVGTPVEPAGPAPDPESGRFDGVLTALEPVRTHTFAVRTDGHGVLNVALNALAKVPTTTFAFQITGPDGAVHPSGPIEGSAAIGLGQPPVGTYAVEVRLESPEPRVQDYRLCWAAEEGPNLAPWAC